ncbi:MAG TPA: hypothetical protein VMG59_13510 [Phycisphaerae bacterium]|nr:hypothetical protein [Phycisphaerae bacterium]
MGMFDGFRRILGAQKPMVVDYEAHEPSTGTHGPNPLHRLGPGGVEPNSYRLQQSYDALLETVHELRTALDGQAQRQEELLSRLSTIPLAVDALPQTSRMQAQMLQLISDRLALHVDQQRKISEVMSNITTAGKDQAELLRAVREQIETANEIDQQLVEAFNRFSMMVDRLQSANNHAVECLQQVRDSYAASVVQVQDWVDKSRNRNSWLVNSAFIMALVSLIVILIMLMYHK